HPAEDDGARADRRTLLDRDRQELPVGLRLQTAAGGRARELVVHEDDPVPDEHVVLDRDSGTDEGMALDLAVRADDRTALDLDEGADPRPVAERAAVEVGERRDDDAGAEGDVVDQAVRGVIARASGHDRPIVSGPQSTS